MSQPADLCVFTPSPVRKHCARAPAEAFHSIAFNAALENERPTEKRASDVRVRERKKVALCK